MSLLNVERALEALNRMISLDQQFKQVMTTAVTARGAALSQCESQLASIDPQLRRASEELVRALLTIKQSYSDRVTVPVRFERMSDGQIAGRLGCGCADPLVTAIGASPEAVTRSLQQAVDEQVRV